MAKAFGVSKPALFSSQGPASSRDALSHALLETVRIVLEQQDALEQSQDATQGRQDNPLKHEASEAHSDDESSEPLDSGQQHPSKKSQKSGVPSGPCAHCGTAESPQWRRPLTRNIVLCNACGIYYSRHHSMPKRKKVQTSKMPSQEGSEHLETGEQVNTGPHHEGTHRQKDHDVDAPMPCNFAAQRMQEQMQSVVNCDLPALHIRCPINITSSTESQRKSRASSPVESSSKLAGQDLKRHPTIVASPLGSTARKHKADEDKGDEFPRAIVRQTSINYYGRSSFDLSDRCLNRPAKRSSAGGPGSHEAEPPATMPGSYPPSSLSSGLNPYHHGQVAYPYRRGAAPSILALLQRPGGASGMHSRAGASECQPAMGHPSPSHSAESEPGIHRMVFIPMCASRGPKARATEPS